MAIMLQKRKKTEINSLGSILILHLDQRNNIRNLRTKPDRSI